MSLFKKTRWKAYAATIPLIPEEADHPHTYESQILSAVMQDRSIAKHIIAASVISLPGKVRSMLNYARRHYFLGLPTSDYRHWTELDDENLIPLIIAMVDTFSPTPITLTYEYLHVTERELHVHSIHQRWQIAYTKFPWGDGKKHTWCEDDATIKIPVINPDTGTFYEAPNVLNWVWQVQDILNIPQVITVNYTDNTGAAQTYSHYMGGSVLKDYVYAIRYSIADPDRVAGIQWRYWTYRPGYMKTKTIPELEDTPPGIDNNYTKEFLPMAVIMQDKEEFNADKDSVWAKDTKKLLRYLALDGDDIIESFLEEEIKKIEKWDFYLHFGVPMHTKTDASKRFLYENFKEISYHAGTTLQEFADYLEKKTKEMPVEELTIHESGDTGYVVNYRWTMVHHQDLDPAQIDAADLPKRGKSNIRMIRRKNNNPEWKAAWAQLFPSLGEVKRKTRDVAHDLVILTHNSVNTNTIGRVVLTGLSMQYSINTRTDGSLRLRTYEPVLFSKDEEELGEFIIPVNVGILRSMPPIPQEAVLADALHATAFLVQKIKSYRGFFKWLVIIVAIVVAVLTYNYQLIPAAAAAIAGASAMVFYIAYGILTVLFSMLLTFASSMISSEWGQLAFMFALLFISMDGWDGIKQGIQSVGTNVANAWGTMLRNPGIMSAFNFINSIDTFLNVGFYIYEKRYMADLERNFERLEQDQRDQAEAIENAYNNMLDAPSWIDPLDLVKTPAAVGIFEDPDGFLARTLNSNPGVLGLEFPEIFMESAVNFPRNLGESDITMDQYYQLMDMRGA